MSVYDDKKLDKEEPPKANKDSDESSSDGGQSSSGSFADHLKAAEEAGNTTTSTGADEEESALSSNDDTVGRGYTGGGKKRTIPFFASGRNKIITGVVTTMVVGGGFFAFLQAPSLVINQLREMLLTKVSQLQNHHTRKYRRKKIHKIGDMFTRDGRRGGKIIAEMERRGYKFAFDGNRIVGVTPPGANASIVGAGIADHLNDYLEVSHPLRTSKWKTKRMEAFYKRYKVTRRPVIVKVPGDPDDPKRAVNKKMFADVYGEDVRYGTSGHLQGQEGETKEQAAARDGSNAEHDTLAKGDGSLEDLKKKLRDGTPIQELTQDERNLLRIGAGIDDEILEMAEKAARSGGLGFSTLKGVFSATDILDKVCTVKNRMTAVQVAARHFRALSMLRYASTFIKAADKARAGKATPGDIDPKMMSALLGRTTSVDANGNALGASPGIAYILKGKFSKSKNDSFKGSFGVDGTLSGFPKAMQDSTSHFPGMSKCGIIQNPIAQVGVAIIELGIGIFTGGGSKVATEGAKQTATQLIKQSLKNLLSKQVAKQLAKSIAIELTFEGMMALTQMYAEKSMAISFTGQEQGGELGSIIGGGAGTLNKQRSLQGGMVPATAGEYESANNQYVSYKKEEQQNQSFFTRILDYENTDSVAFQTMFSVATAPSGIDGLRARATQGFSKLGSTLINLPAMLSASLLSQQAYAQNPDEITHDTYTTGGKNGGIELATDPAGNLLPIMRSDIEDIDPDTNIQQLIASKDINPDSLEPISERFTGHIKNCIENVDTLSTIEYKDQADPKYDCLAKQAITKQFKAHLAYMDMVDTIDASLFPEEISFGEPTTLLAKETENVPETRLHSSGSLRTSPILLVSVNFQPFSNSLGRWAPVAMGSA